MVSLPDPTASYMFLSYEFSHLLQDTIDNVHAPYDVTRAYRGGANFFHIFQIPDPDFLFTIHRVSKNVPPLACCNFDTCEQILIFFGRNFTDKVSNQTHFTMPHQINCASALHRKTRKLHFPRMLY